MPSQGTLEGCASGGRNCLHMQGLKCEKEWELKETVQVFKITTRNDSNNLYRGRCRMKVGKNTIISCQIRTVPSPRVEDASINWNLENIIFGH